MGFLILVPTVLGILFAIMMCFSTVYARNSMISVAHGYPGIAGGTAFDLVYPLGIAACSFAVGAIGWLYIVKKKLYRCVKCRYILQEEIDRLPGKTGN